jgi:hypothetical protein
MDFLLPGILAMSIMNSGVIGLLELARANGIELTELRSNQASLEDVFLTLTGRSFEPAVEAAEIEDATTKRRFWQRKKAA